MRRISSGNGGVLTGVVYSPQVGIIIHIVRLIFFGNLRISEIYEAHLQWKW